MGLPDAELSAEEVVRLTGQTGPPVDLQEIVSLWPGLNLSVDDLDGEGYLVDLGARGGEIIIRADAPASRQRFTLAHELGHWFLRQNGFSVGLHVKDEPHSVTEQWCDQFGASLLMPRPWIAQELRNAKVRSLLGVLTSAPSMRYGVSDQAFRLRIAHIAPVSIFEVSSGKGEIAVERRFESSHLRSELVLAALAEVMQSIRSTRARQQIATQFHPGTGLQSVCKCTARGPGPQRWLVCVFRNHLIG